MAILFHDKGFENTFHFIEGVSSPTQVWALGAWVKPVPFPKAQRILTNLKVADEFGLSDQDFHSLDSWIREGKGPNPRGYWSTNYAGHQFGVWAGQLGDGRVQFLATVKDSQGNPWEWQIKGNGPTPFSRFGDGLAVVRSTLREFLVSEYLHQVKIPSTRTLAMWLTHQPVMRDMFYDGNPKEEPGALCLRIAPNFLRFGHFELLAWRKEVELAKKLFCWLWGGEWNLEEAKKRFKEITEKTLNLILDWMSLGFIHGVMNTDNMSLLGLTIDFGPFGWLNEFDPHFTSNTSDQQGRYCWINQYEMVLWNLHALAFSWARLLEVDQKFFFELLNQYQKSNQEVIRLALGRKWGWLSLSKEQSLFLDKLNFGLQNFQIDFHLFFKWWELNQFFFHSARENSSLLNNCRVKTLEIISYLPKSFISPRFERDINLWIEELISITTRYQWKIQPQPWFLPRNHLLHEASQRIEKDQDPSLAQKLLKLCHNPWDPPQKEIEFTKEELLLDFWMNFVKSPLYQKTPDWALNKPGCNRLSCSS